MKTLNINRIHKLPIIVLTFLALALLPKWGWAYNVTVYTWIGWEETYSAGTVTGGGSYSSGATCTINIYPASGYALDWVNVGSYDVVYETSFSFIVTDNIDIEVHFKTAPKHYLYLYVNSTSYGSITSPSSGVQIAEGSTTTLSYSANTGYQFSSWTVDGTGSSVSGNTFKMGTADATVTAIFEAKTYSITLNKNGGSNNGSATATYKSTSLTGISAPTRTGYHVDGYYTESGCTTYIATSSGSLQKNVSGYTNSSKQWTKDGTATLYPKWAINTYSVKFNKNNTSASGTMSNQAFTYGTAQNLTANAFTRSGYRFAGWATSSSGSVVYSDGQSVNNLTTTNGGTVNLYAKWTQLYNITLSAGTGGSISTTPTAGTSVAAQGDEVTVSVSPTAGYQLSTLKYNDGSDHTISASGGVYKFTMPAKNVTVSATFTKITYTITCNPSEGSPSNDCYVSYSGTAQVGNSISVTAYPASGYQLSTLKYNDGSDHPLTATNNSASFTMPAHDVTITATFTKITYTITCNPSEGSPSNGCYVSYTGTPQYGLTITIGVTVGTNYELETLKWNDGSDHTLTVGSTPYTFTMPAHDVTITGTFKLSGYTVTASTASGGNVLATTTTGTSGTSGSSSTATVNANGNATLTATAANGYTFMYWSESSTIYTDNPLTISGVNAAHSLTAHFVQQNASGTWPANVISGTDYSAISTINISTANELAWLVSVVNGLNEQTGNTLSGKTINLTADLNMSSYTWVPIGTTEHPFAGTFNGNGHTISGITRSTEFPYQGLFGYVSGGTIHDVVVNTNLTGNSLYSGGVVGYLASGSTVYNTGSTGTVAPSGSNTIAVGGTVGYNAGLVHSSFAVGTVTGQTGDYVGGLVGSNTGGRVFNSYSDATNVSGGNAGGLVGTNTGTVANCYVAGVTSGKYAFAHTNSSTIQYCYANNAGTAYCSSGSASGHGLYSALPEPESFSLKSKDYMYRDNYITLASGSSTTYVPQSGATTTYTYDNGHTIKWNGLVSALNQWVAANPNSVDNLSKWYRPLTLAINGDLPVLGFGGETTLGAANASPKVLKYGGLDALMDGYGSGAASVFLYGKESSVSNPPGSDTHVYLAEDAVLIQASLGTENFARTTADITFDNSCGEDVSTQGKPLEYDWHLMSTPFKEAPIGISYNDASAHGASSGVDISGMSNGFFPNDLTMTTPAPSGEVKWDLYAFDESNHLWVNFKRNKANHYNADGNNITYNGADQTTGNFTPGKGYMMAISQPTYMCTENGTLNNRNITLTLTNTSGSRDSGANLIGNPYHGYLDLNKIYEADNNLAHFYVYDADQKTFALYAKRASRNTRAASRYVHPHQGFFVIAPSGGTSLTLSPSMVGTTDTEGYFRDDEQVNYPLVNLFVENELGQRDMATIELHRPELGGAMKIDQLRNTDFEIAARMNSERYALLFTPEGTERVPVNFRTETDGTYKLTWDTQNGEFYSLFLIDNKTGMTYNMLANDSYTFEANSRDYASRFYITYDCSGTGIEENNEDNGGYGISNFAYIDNGNIVVDVETQNFASLQVIDVLGRVLYSTTCGDGARTVSTNGLAKGVYILRLSSNKGTQTQKIVVQ